MTEPRIVVHAMHPGIVSTNFINHADQGTQDYYRRKSDLLTADQGADTLIWLATAVEPGKTTGKYYYERAVRATSAAADDINAAERLWRESEKITAGATSDAVLSPH